MLGFFTITFAVTWASWLAAYVIAPSGVPASPLASMLRTAAFLLGVLAPAFVALALTARQHGRSAAVALFDRIFRWNVPLRFYLFAAGYIALIKLAVAVIYRFAYGTWPRFGTVPWYVMAAAMLVSTWVQAGEEIGWRGFALPRLAARFGLGGASASLGVVWACWHLPLFFIPSTSTTGQSFPLYLLQVTAISVALGWLYWQTGGSLLLVMLLHAAVNNTKDIVPSAVPNGTEVFTFTSSPVAWLTVLLLWLGAAYFLLAMRRADFQRGDSQAVGAFGTPAYEPERL